MSSREATPVGTVLRTPTTFRVAFPLVALLFAAAAVWRFFNAALSGASLVGTIVLTIIALSCILAAVVSWRYAVWFSSDGMTLHVRNIGPRSTFSVALRSPTTCKVTRRRQSGRGGGGGTISVTFRQPDKQPVRIGQPWVAIDPLLAALQPALRQERTLAADEATARVIADPALLDAPDHGGVSNSLL